MDESQVAQVLRECVEAFEAAEVPYVLVGGVASAVYGRPRFTADIDFFVRGEDAKRALEALGGAGLETEETNPAWIYKAWKNEVQIDVLFRVTGDVYVDDEMLERSRELEFLGVRARFVAPEDLIVIKAAVHDEQTPRHWHDALAVIADCELDWDYLAQRARKAARRVLALLIYAQSNDLIVTDDVVRSLFETVYRSVESRA
jgi:predicted nucleotidyltransferase